MKELKRQFRDHDSRESSTTVKRLRACLEELEKENKDVHNRMCEAQTQARELKSLNDNQAETILSCQKRYDRMRELENYKEGSDYRSQRIEELEEFVADLKEKLEKLGCI